MFTTKITVYTEKPITSDQMLDEADMLLTVIYDDWSNLYTKSYELGYVNKYWFFNKFTDQPKVIQTIVSASQENRGKFLDCVQPIFDKMIEKLAKNSITMEIQQEDNVTDIIGVEEYMD